MKRAQMVWIGQAVLIVLPVAILSGVALHFLREDKAAIEQDAKRRANAIAPDVARQIGDEIGVSVADAQAKGLVTRGAIVDGRGMAAIDYPRLPSPSNWVEKLPPREAGLWRTAESARFQQRDAKAARAALTALAQSGNSAPARANAALGLLLVDAEGRGDAAALIRQAVRVARQYPDAVTESGTQVADAALLAALRRVKGELPADLAGAIENQTTQHPSFLSTDLLYTAALRAQWEAQESQRQKVRYTMQDFVPRLRGRPNTATVLYWDDSARQERGSHPGLALCAPYRDGWAIMLLRVELKRGVENRPILVIDHIEKPTGN